MHSKQEQTKVMCHNFLFCVWTCLVIVLVRAASLPPSSVTYGNASSRYYGGEYYNCLSQRVALKRAYYAQIDLIRRGLPWIVVQAEYTWAMNRLGQTDGYFRYWNNLDAFCIADFSWGKLFDSENRAFWAIKYIQFIQSYDPEIHFLTFNKHPELPAMTSAEMEIADELWLNTEKSFLHTPRENYPLSAFKFPSNIQVLYDPYRDMACAEYQQFGSVEGPDVPNAHDVLLQLLVSSIQLFRMGADREDIEAMLRHFVAFCFDGIRCKRHEDRSVKIPLMLHSAYAQSSACLYAKIVNPSERPLITEEAVETVFGEEITSLVSYNSWGNTEYAVLTQSTSIPKLYNSLHSIFDSDKNDDLEAISARQVQRQMQTLGNSPHSLTRPQNFTTAVHSVSCPEGYVYFPRSDHVNDPLEHCCACACEIWNVAVAPFTLAIESCCSRCNAFTCVGELTESDIINAEMTEILVPEYGEREEAVFQMLIV